MVRVKSSALAFGFASSADPAGGNDDISNSSDDRDVSNPQGISGKQPDRKPILNFRKPSGRSRNRDSQIKRQQRKQKLLDFIKQVKSAGELEEIRRREKRESERRLREEARKQAAIKAEAARVARLEAEKARRQKLLREKIEKAQEKKEKLVSPPDLRPAKKERLLAFIGFLRDKHQKELINKTLAKQALRKQKEIAAKAAMEEKQAKAIQAAEFKARQKQLALQKKELLKAELVLAARKKQEKEFFEKKQKETDRQVREISSKIGNSVSALTKSSAAIIAAATGSVSAAVKKAKSIRVPKATDFAAPSGLVAVPEKPAKAVAEKPKKYREPIKPGPFLRRNAFRLLFLLLLLMWLGEILFYTMRWKPPRERFEEMYGSTQERATSATQVAIQPQQEIKVEEYRVPSINIEGKRDPFSGGLLTMELVKKPRQAEIMLAYKPEIITITKKPSIVSQPIQKPVREKPEKITPILKPEKPEPTLPSISEATVSKILPPAPVSKPEISPLIIPQIECPLVYRGSLIMEGIEYIFLEGKHRTYRVTVGDVVEGFRILKKEKGTITLSREGVIIEIPAE